MRVQKSHQVFSNSIVVDMGEVFSPYGNNQNFYTKRFYEKRGLTNSSKRR